MIAAKNPRDEALIVYAELDAAGVRAMVYIQRWTASFDYENLDAVIASMQSCNAFEKSRMQHKLLFPHGTGVQSPGELP